MLYTSCLIAWPPFQGYFSPPKSGLFSSTRKMLSSSLNYFYFLLIFAWNVVLFVCLFAWQRGNSAKNCTLSCVISLKKDICLLTCCVFWSSRCQGQAGWFIVCRIVWLSLRKQSCMSVSLRSFWVFNCLGCEEEGDSMPFILVPTPDSRHLVVVFKSYTRRLFTTILLFMHCTGCWRSWQICPSYWPY